MQTPPQSLFLVRVSIVALPLGSLISSLPRTTGPLSDPAGAVAPMTSQDSPLDNGILAIPKTNSVVVQVTELPLSSPTQELASTSCHGLVEILGKMEGGQIDTSRAWIQGLNLKRPQTGDGQRSSRDSHSRARRRSSVGSMDSNSGDSYGHGLTHRPTMQLPSFEEYSGPIFLSVQSKAYQRPRDCAELRETSTDPARPASGARSESTGLYPTQSWPLMSHMDASSFHYPSGIQPLLTPPEDIDSFKWDTAIQTESADNFHTVPENESGRGRGSQTQEQPRSSQNTNTRPSEIQLPAPSDMASDESNMPLWLARACQHLGEVPQNRLQNYNC